MTEVDAADKLALEQQINELAALIRYPEEWDTTKFPTLVSAMTDVVESYWESK